jgi:CheY-like chemotaxis protein
MSHEIRTPLNAIMGMAVIAKKTAISEKTITSLDEITSASNHLLGIINDVLDMSKIESGKFVLVNEAFSLKETIKEVADLIGPRCREKNIRFLDNYGAVPSYGLIGDKLRLKQVLINLLGNAVKFTPELGEIDLVLMINEETETELNITFSVKDSGIGMTDEQVSRLFTPFEQADKTIAVRFGGTGLGLAISQNLIREMGGIITVQSSQGQGSSFLFTLIMQKTDQLQDAEKTEDEVPDLFGKRILLAEDVEINRIILIELLEDTNVVVDEAADGQKAVDMFATSEEYYYDLVFMDVQMPNMDGYEATRRIRSLQRHDAKRVPIIAMTANAYRDDIDNALRAGMDGHIAKPIDINIVMRVLKEKVGKKR